MPAFSGSALVITWTTSTGTTTLSGDQRSCTYTPTIEFIDETAGADQFKNYLGSVKDATADAEIIYQAAGTAVAAQTGIGQLGTLVIQPQGTAASLQKITTPSYISNSSWAIPYNDVVVLSLSWQQTGAGTVGTN